MLHFFSASNGIVNSRKAMVDCLESALGSEDTLDCRLIVIHASIAHQFHDILDEAKKRAPSARIVGCTCAGVIGNGGANESMKALGIMAVKTDQAGDFSIAYCENIRGDNSFQMARGMAESLKAQNPGVNMIQILASGIDIAADRAIEGIESVFGPHVPIFGGTSSDNMRATSTFQFVDQQVLERGAILIGYADPTLEVVMGVHHGSVPIGIGYKVTKAEGNRVYEIENQPAWPFIMEKLNLPPDSHPGPCIPVAGIGELLPEELHELYGNTHILRVIVKTADDGSFYMPVDCRPGAIFWLTQRNEERIFSGLDNMIRQMKARIGDRPIAAVFHTDCAARGRALFNKILKDEIIRRMQYPLVEERQAPWLGMYGFGEFTMLGGRNYFHNYTTSIYALLRK